MWIDVLQTFGEFIVETIDKTDDAASYANHTIRLSGGRAFVKVIIIISFLLDSIGRIASHNGD